MTQAEVTELMVILREFQGLGWPIATDSSPFEAVVRDWLENEMEARGLWIPFLNKLDELALAELDARGEPGEVPPNERRPTLLEVARL